MSKIEITPEMIEEARKKREAEKHLTDINEDPGQAGICIGCE